MKALKYILILLMASLVAKGQLDPLANSSSFQLVDSGVTQVVFPVSVGSLPSDSISGERGVIWLHGLAGSVESWGRVATATESQLNYVVPGYPARKVKSFNPEYYSLEHQLMEGAAIGLHNLIETSIQTSVIDTLPRMNNFVIAHSQGGLMARTMRELTRANPGLYSKQYNGIVTFGTPHNGAVVLNKMDHGGHVMQWLNAGCYRLGVATLTAKVSSHWLMDVVISQDDIHSVTTVACNVFSNTFLESLVNGFKRPITTDYEYNASYINNLNNSLPDTLHKVAFYGIETEPVLWRTMTSLTASDTLISHNPFNMDDDSHFVTVAQQYINHYHHMEQWNRRLANDFTTVAILSLPLYMVPTIISLHVRDRKLEKAEDYKLAKEWLQSANRTWKRIIGSDQMVDTLEGYECICIDPSMGSDVTRIVPTPADCVTQGDESKCFMMGASYNQINVKKPSDGVVLAESASMFPGAGHVVPMGQTNHQQIRNSTKTRDMLNNLFSGYYGNYFLTEER